MTLAQEILDARILIVDDQDANVRLLSRLLGEAGYTGVASTTNPAQVCALHARSAFDVILLDIQMPGMDGFEVIDALKAGEVDGYLPVIVLTAEPAHKVRALQAGAKDFISKPFDLVEVKTRIHNMLEVRLLYRKLDEHNQQLERIVEERTAQLRESEARFRSLTELASDWYWEQDASGAFTRVFGPVQEMLGLGISPSAEPDPAAGAGWIESERAALQARIAARQPFLDFVFHRIEPNGARREFRVSGEPIFSPSCRFIGYRGIGVENTS